MSDVKPDYDGSWMTWQTSVNELQGWEKAIDTACAPYVARIADLEVLLDGRTDEVVRANAGRKKAEARVAELEQQIVTLTTERDEARRERDGAKSALDGSHAIGFREGVMAERKGNEARLAAYQAFIEAFKEWKRVGFPGVGQDPERYIAVVNALGKVEKADS